MEAVSSAWEAIDWDGLQKNIEYEIEALGKRQDDGEKRRENLVMESNSYRERTNKETRKLAVPLIKAFQNEFDGLIQRSQTAEAALISICSSITNLPDPKSLLKGAEAWKADAEKTKRAIEEREGLNKSLKELQTELADLKNQDVEVRKLKTEIAKREAEHEKLIENAVEDVAKHIREEFEAKIEEMNGRNEKMKAENQGLEKKINELDAKNRESQRKVDAAKMAVDQKESIEDEQLAIAMKDLADAREKIIHLEEQLEQTKLKALKKPEGENGIGLVGVAEFGKLMAQRDEQISKLEAEMKVNAAKHAEEIKAWKDKVVDADKKLKKFNVEVNELRRELETKSDYETIKNELRLMREIEFGPEDESSETVANSLDRLFADKNRRLQNDNANLRVLNENFKGDSSPVDSLITGSEVVEIAVSRSIVSRELSTPPVEPTEPKVFPLDSRILVEDPNMNLLTYIQQQMKEKEKRPRTNGASTSTGGKHVQKHATHTITTTELTPMTLKKLQNNEEEEMKSFIVADAVPTTEDEKREMEIIKKMQEKIQVNVANLAKKALNTTEIAKQCKKLMIAYNIGQRLFAKHVMNQVVKSQGSLSELLSKPRHWSKLTDKGREAFRRIYGWISDGEAIDLLCSLSPRRIWPAEQKIDIPSPESLWEKSEESKENPKALTLRQLVTPGRAAVISSPEPVSSPPVPVQEAKPIVVTPPAPAPTSSASSSSARTSRWRHDDISKEKILSIFNSELAKLKEQQEEGPVEKGSAKAAASSIHPNTRRSGTNPPISVMVDPIYSQNKRRPSNVEAVLQSRITTGLLPITQVQYDSFAMMDTDVLVKQIKDLLTVNSISQRQFGEFVLGLSQGSVSDLLARPKTWSQLTQKGREPFIRMKLFMDEVDNHGSVKVEKEEELDEGAALAKTLETFIKDTLKMQAENVKVEPISEIDLMMQTECSSDLQSLVKHVEANGDEILDTFEIVRRVKLVLEENGVSPRIFGENYLDCAPHLCADLLLRTKSFEVSKPMERILYGRMKYFLQDRDAITMLIQKEAMRETPRDKFDLLFRELKPLKRKGSSDFEDEQNPKKPIQRTVITDYQKNVLRFVFMNDPHPTNEMCESMADKMDMSLRTVLNWFHNHRTRSKAREKEGKVYSDALPTGNTKKSNNWKIELERMLENAPSPSTPREKSLENADSNDIMASIISNIKPFTPSTSAPPEPMEVVERKPSIASLLSTNAIVAKKPASSTGTLDRLVAKMRQMQENREASKTVS